MAETDLFTFEWAVDQGGYEFAHHQQGGPGIAPLDFYDVRRRGGGGPMRFYRPLDEHPGLWRRFADTCSSPEGVLSFVNEFGLLTDEPQARVRAKAERQIEPQTPQRIPSSSQPLDNILRAAAFIGHLAGLIEGGKQNQAADVLNKYPPEMIKLLSFNKRASRYETHVVPLTLRDALLHQVGETIAGNYKWRRCRNNGCPEWFRIGERGHTIRREFCSDRCRVAAARARVGGRVNA